MARIPRTLRRSTAVASTSTWGRREVIRPGIHTALPPVEGGPGSGLGEDIGVRKRPFDVRMDTLAPGNISRPFTLYVTSRAFYDPSFTRFGGVPDASVAARTLFAVLETGGGGITRAEEFVLPQHGKAIHIGADSVRLFVVYEPDDIQVTPDNAVAMIGFQLNANVAVSGLYPGEVRTQQFNPLVTAVPQTTIIPQFSTALQIAHPALSMLDVSWVDIFGMPVDPAPLNGTDFVEPYPIPAPAAQVTILYPGGGGPIATNTPLLRWDRPS